MWGCFDMRTSKQKQQKTPTRWPNRNSWKAASLRGSKTITRSTPRFCSTRFQNQLPSNQIKSNPERANRTTLTFKKIFCLFEKKAVDLLELQEALKQATIKCNRYPTQPTLFDPRPLASQPFSFINELIFRKCCRQLLAEYLDAQGIAYTAPKPKKKKKQQNPTTNPTNVVWCREESLKQKNAKKIVYLSDIFLLFWRPNIKKRTRRCKNSNPKTNNQQLNNKSEGWPTAIDTALTQQQVGWITHRFWKRNQDELIRHPPLKAQQKCPRWDLVACYCLLVHRSSATMMDTTKKKSCRQNGFFWWSMPTALTYQRDT